MTVATFHDQAALTTDGQAFARWVTLLEPAAALAERIASTDFVPEAMRGNPAAITAAIMYGDELGLGPMQALNGINPIRGRVSPSAELMRALVFRAGHTMRILKSDGTLCRILGKRSDEREGTVIEWTIAMAGAADLLSNPTWRRYPRAMLLARASSELCRIMFPDVIKGLSHVADDDAIAAGFDDWATTETGTPSEPPSETRTVARKPIQRAQRAVQTTELPPAADDGPPYSPQATQSAESDEAWPMDVEQPPLPHMPPAATTAAAGNPSPSVQPAAAPVDPLPTPDDSELAREAEPIGPGKMLTAIHSLFSELGLSDDDRPLKLAISAAAVGRQVTSTKLLTRREGLRLVRVLNDLNQGLRTFGINPDGSVTITPDESETQA